MVRRLLVVVAAQWLVLMLGMVLASGLLIASGATTTLLPHTFRVPIQPLRADAAPDAAVADLRAAFPGDDVVIRNGEFVVTFTTKPAEYAWVRTAFNVLDRHGFQRSTFKMGPDLGFMRAVRRLTTDVSFFTTLLPSMPLVFILGGWFLRARTLRQQGPPRRPIRQVALAGVGGGIALVILVELLSLLMTALGNPLVEQPWVSVMMSGGAVPLVLLVIGGIVLAPVGEELFYRGWVLPYLGEVNPAFAFVVTTLLFAAVHLHLPAVPAYLALGAGFALLYRWTDSIWAPILAHATNNAITIAVLLFTR